ncbi:PilT/PilU family type 4a pilus ATPase [Lentisphaerota bacterium ZTH]|nr:PilT/PilU family type 4a pilus ATPase [Lentisphaerota bacterium]WET06360.1 PilT/PilU family type 4a pilus ATPase [Lentisphaerota bacterium ZTH]
MQIEELLQSAFDSDVSDLFLTAGKRPYMRRLGDVVAADCDFIKTEEIEAFRQKVLLPGAEKTYQEAGSFDAGITLGQHERFRLNFLTQQGVPALVARPVPVADDLAFDQLNLPETIREFAGLRRGLILVAGAAGSGKSTTLAAMVNYINDNFNKHVVTIEDPIEYVHRDKNCLVTQREVGADTVNFSEALRNVVRESPDVIVIGEMRDLATMQTAITAALTGHLVISTVHTADCVQSIERIINHFPDHLRKQAADDLSLALEGIVAQRLLPRSDTEGMIPAVELMKSTPIIRSIIAERNFKELEEAIKRGKEEGMVTFNRALFEMVKEGTAAVETCAAAATNRDEFLLLVRGMESGIETFRNKFDKDAADEEVINMKRLLQSAVAVNASDLLLTAGCPPTIRVNGELLPLDTDSLTPGDTQRLLFSILTPRQRAQFEAEREIDFALSISMQLDAEQEQAEQFRFRVNGFYQRGNVGTAVRVIPKRIPKPEELHIPPPIVNLAEKRHGLILVTGPTGHGKSTTLASMIDKINSERGCHIITVEDPIEYVHENSKAVVEQREVGADTHSFANALKYVLRQDPDVILVGEMRDTETIAAALTAAETGHLVLATLHTNNAPQSIDRIIDSFPGHQQNQIKLQLAGTLLGVVSQRLIPHKSGDGRVAVFEVMVGTPAVQALVREGKTQQLQSVIETSFKDGMITMDKALEEVYSKGLIERKHYAALTRNFKNTKGY